jgi:hypothetical protein
MRAISHHPRATAVNSQSFGSSDVSNARCQAKLAQTVPYITSRSSVLAFDRAHLDVVMRKLVPELQAFS